MFRNENMLKLLIFKKSIPLSVRNCKSLTPLVYSPGGTEIKSCILRRGLGDLDPKVEKNSNYDYFEIKYILNTNEV